MQHKNPIMKLLVCTIAAVLGWAVASQAVIIVTNGGLHPNGFYSASSNDLGAAATTSFSGSAYYGSSAPPMIDGTVYGTQTPFDTAFSLLPGYGSVMTVNLDVAHGLKGFNLTSIVSLTGADGGGQGSRLPQDYVVAYSTISNPSLFLPLATVLQSAGGADNSEFQVTVADTTLGKVIASNVAKLQFTFSPDNGGPGDGLFYREFDIFGTAEVPEPSTLLLLAVGGLVVRRQFRARRV